MITICEAILVFMAAWAIWGVARDAFTEGCRDCLAAMGLLGYLLVALLIGPILWLVIERLAGRL
jgi:Na+/proline symporter